MTSDTSAPPPAPNPDAVGSPVVAPSAAGLAVSDFGKDAGPTGVRDAVGAYVAKVRGGDAGVLPALVGLFALCLVFTLTKSSFLTDRNIANLLQQATWLIILAMGVTFVLLIGEIDLAAGAMMGVTGAIIYLRVNNGMPAAAMVIVCGAIGIGAAVLVAHQLRKSGRPPGASVAIGVAVGGVVAIVLAVFAPVTMTAVLLGMVVGLAMGTFTGYLVARVGIPSFVVTLALFLAWQGLLLKIAKEGGTISVDDKFLATIGTASMNPTLGWILFLMVVAGFGGGSLLSRASRVRKGVSAQPLSVIVAKTMVLAAVWGFATWRLNQDRATRNATKPIEGVPWVVPLVLGLTVVLTFALTRTRWGRHLYAVGGSAEAARRAGINVAGLRLSAFALVGLMATIAGLLYGSRVGSITPQTGAGTELLRAVGAAVVGGISLFGGRGKVVYAVVGGLVLAVIDNGLGLYTTIFGTEVDAGFKNIVAGAVLLVAGSFDALTRRGTSAAR